MQALYQWILTATPIDKIIREFENERTELKKADKEYFLEILTGSENNIVDLEQIISQYLDREIGKLDPVERAILNLGAYELKYKVEVPVNVVIDESIELAKMFGAEDSHKYVNGVMDKLAKALR